MASAFDGGLRNGFWRETLASHGLAAEHSSDQDCDARLETILGNYYSSATDDEPSRLAWIARYPDFAADLAAYFLEQDRLYQLTRPLRAAAPHVTEPESGLLGDFELLEEIARGGMGVVYKARQVSLNRVVALKVIIAGEFAGPAAVQRFRDEAEAVALLDHPNIVPIYEVGFEHGRHFFSMKYFEGGSLADRLDRFVAKPRGAVELMATVARAVHHAHQRGVLHRDLKPSNILLDAQGRPHVVDFGLAKRVEGDGQLTASGAILGSPPYMAPEQTSGQRRAITTATDVYGLGALLYSLLTGRAPFQADSVWETIELVKDRVPDPPSELNRLVNRDLQTICLRCLEKEPSRRYPSAEAVADELDHWLRGEPIAARPVGWLEHLWRWWLRNPMLASAAAVVGLLFLALIGVLAASNHVLSRKQAEVVRQRVQAEASLGLARDAVDQMYSRVAEQWLAYQPRLEPIQRDFLEEALRFYESFARERGSDSGAQRRAAAAQFRVAEIRAKLGRNREAEDAYRRLIDRVQGLIDQNPGDPEDLLLLSKGLRRMGNVLRMTGQAKEAEAASRRAVAVAGAAVAARPSAEAEYTRNLARAYDNLGYLQAEAGRVDDAEQAYHRALEIQQRLAGRPDAETEDRYLLATIRNNLGMLCRSAGRTRDAAEAFRQALAEIKPLTVGPGARTAYRESRAYIGHNLSLVLWQTDNAPDAVEAVKDACQTLEALAEEHPDVPEYQEEGATARNTLGMIFAATGRLDGAEDAYRRSIADLERLVTHAPAVSSYRWNLGSTLGNLGSLLADRHRPAEAEESFRRSLGLYEELVAQHPQFPDYRRELALYLQGLGNALVALDRLPEAERALSRSLAVREALAAEHPKVPDFQVDVARSQKGLGTVLRLAGRLPEAEHAYVQALALLEASDSEHRYREGRAELMGNLGIVRARQGRVAEAIDAYRRSIAMYEALKAGLPDSDRLRDALAARWNDLAWLLANGTDPRLRDTAQAIELARKATEQATDRGDYRNTLGLAHYRAGDCGAAIEVLEKWIEQNAGGNARDWLILAMAHWQRGHRDEARSWYAKAVAWMDENKLKDEELRRFRAEAKALIQEGNLDAMMPKGADAFAH